jgi:hypothetical protein
MLDYIKQMLAGEDGKPSSGKIMKIIAFIIAIILCIVQIFIDKDLSVIFGWLFGFAGAGEAINKIGNGLQSMAIKNIDIQGK